MSVMNGLSTIERGSTDDLLDIASKRQISSKAIDDQQASMNANGVLTEFEMSHDELTKQKALEALMQNDME